MKSRGINFGKYDLYNIQRLDFISCSVDDRSGDMDDPRTKLQDIVEAIGCSKLKKSLNKMEIQDYNILEEEVKDLLNENGLGHIKLL